VSNIKTVKPNASWVITDQTDKEKVGAITKEQGNNYLLRYQGFNKTLTKEQLVKSFGTQLFTVPEVKPILPEANTVYEYSIDVDKPFNKMFYVKKKLPIFTKENKSKSFYCAGHYLVQKKSWTEMFCPKLITLEKYKFHGPFKNQHQMMAFKKKFL
jgi:hypothetical protein